MIDQGNKSKFEEPIRIHKFLAQNGFGSRREIEKAIIDTKIGIAKFIHLTETKTNIAAVV